jgi:hypothetical protein
MPYLISLRSAVGLLFELADRSDIRNAQLVDGSCGLDGCPTEIEDAKRNGLLSRLSTYRKQVVVNR